MRIERADERDAPELVSVQIAAFHHDAVLYPGVPAEGPPGYDSAAAMLEKIQGDDCYRIVDDDGKIIGGIVIFAMAAGHFHLDLIFIDPAHHNRGIGTQALKQIEQAYGAELWTLDTPAYALRNQHFYEKLGYVRVRTWVHAGVALIAYEKRMGQG